MFKYVLVGALVGALLSFVTFKLTGYKAEGTHHLWFVLAGMRVAVNVKLRNMIHNLKKKIQQMEGDSKKDDDGGSNDNQNSDQNTRNPSD